jgi:hypothetical protein
MKLKFALSFVVAASLAAGGALAAGWNTNSIFVTKIEVGASPSETYLTFSAAPNNKPAACTSAQAYVSASNDQIRTLATAALLSGKEVRVFWDASCKASTTYGQISRMEIIN